MSVASIKERDWVSTTEAAAMLGLSHMTIIRRFDAGDLQGFRVPGSRFRRIPKENLREFARMHGLPLKGLEPGGDGEKNAAPPHSGRRVLVVDDDEHLVRLISKVLAADGWSVRTATNGFDAGFAAIRFEPNLVLLDIMLPGVDGRDAARRMRSDPKLALTRILAITALRDERSIREMYEAGIDDYLAKPFTVEALREKIAEIMQNQPAEMTIAG